MCGVLNRLNPSGEGAKLPKGEFLNVTPDGWLELKLYVGMDFETWETKVAKVILKSPVSDACTLLTGRPCNCFPAYPGFEIRKEGDK